MGLISPSYNTLALQALLLAATGLVMLDGARPRVRSAGAVLLGVGGWLAFAAKPTSAVALVALAGVYIAFLRPVPWRQTLWAVLVAALALLLFAFAVDGGPAGHLVRLRSAMELASVLDSGHRAGDLIALPGFPMSASLKLLFAAVLVIAMVSVVAAASTRGLAARLSWYSGLVVALLTGAVLSNVVEPGWWSKAALAPFLLLALALGAGMGAAWVRRKGGSSDASGRLAWRREGLALVLAAFPLAYAFGTNNNLWEVAATAAVFWPATMVMLVCGRAEPYSRTALSMIWASFIVAGLLKSGQAHPYRLSGTLADAEHAVMLGPGASSSLGLNKSFASAIAEAQAAARTHGMREGDPMIDLTGQSPGMVYALGARAPGVPWLLGGYPGSEAYAVASLRRAPCEMLANAWLLAEPNGRGSIPLEVLDRLGLPSRQWQLVGQWTAPAFAPALQRRPPQQLLKPPAFPHVQVASCLAQRAQAKSP